MKCFYVFSKPKWKCEIWGNCIEWKTLHYLIFFRIQRLCWNLPECEEFKEYCTIFKYFSLLLPCATATFCYKYHENLWTRLREIYTWNYATKTSLQQQWHCTMYEIIDQCVKCARNTNDLKKSSRTFNIYYQKGTYYRQCSMVDFLIIFLFVYKLALLLS